MNTHEATAEVVRTEISRQTMSLRLDLEDLERRIGQGLPADMACVATRSLLTTAIRLNELASELKGLETETEKT